MSSVKQDRLNEAFKDSLSDMNGNSRVGQNDFGVWSPTSSEESRKYKKINGASKLSMPLNVNQQSAFDKAIEQLNN